MSIEPDDREVRAGSPLEVFKVFLGLGLTSFGGPIAHLGYFRDAFVVRRRWLSDQAYADLVALCQFLPGPASSQVGMAIGLRRAGYGGMLAAWVAFTLPSAVLLVAFAYGADAIVGLTGTGWIDGLKAAAVAVVAHALLGMARTLTPDRQRATIAVLAMTLVLLVPSALVQGLAILAGMLAGLAWLRDGRDHPGHDAPAGPADALTATEFGPGRRAAVTALGLFVILLVGLPTLVAVVPNGVVGLVDGFYRAGSLVFGGGHVVLPLLEAETVATGSVDRADFLAGYGAAQAVPGPLFTFAAYLGAVAIGGPGGVLGAVLALLAVFLPSVLLVLGGLPFWERARQVPRVRGAVTGAGAAVVGLLAAALYDPLFTEGIDTPAAMATAALAFVALAAWKCPAWVVVVAASLLGLAVL